MLKRTPFAALAVLAVCCLPLAPAAGQDASPLFDYIPADAALAAVIHPKRVMDRPEAAALPLEVMRAASEEFAGFDILDVESAVAVVRVSPERGPEFGVALRFSKWINLEDVVAKLAPEGERKDTAQGTLAIPRRGNDPSVFIPNPQTVILADRELATDMATTATDFGPLRQRLARADSAHDATMFISVDAVRPMIQDALQQGPAPPPQMLEILPLLDMVSTIEVSVPKYSPTEILPSQLRVALHPTDGQSPRDVERLVRRAIEVGHQFALTVMADEMKRADPDNAVVKATASYGRRVLDMYHNALWPKVEGDQVVVTVDDQIAPLAESSMLLGMILPEVVRSHRGSQNVALNRLKLIALAMNNYESRNGTLPPRAIFDKQGKPLLSWRVMMLPDLEEAGLYQQFHLDEPWDSPHNKALIERMPADFQSPGVQGLAPGTTLYQVPVGAGTIFEGKEGMTFSKIKDGASNTILALEVDPERAVIWTKPDDYAVDANQPFAGLGHVRPGGFNAIMADGAGTFFSNSMDAIILKGMFTKDGLEATQR